MKTQNYINAFDLVASFIWGFLAVDSAKIEAMRQATLKVLALIIERDSWKEDNVYANTTKTLLEASKNASFLRSDIPVNFNITGGFLIAAMVVDSHDSKVITSIACNVETLQMRILVTKEGNFIYSYYGSSEGLPDVDGIEQLQTGLEPGSENPLKLGLKYLLIAGVSQKAEALMRKG